MKLRNSEKIKKNEYKKLKKKIPKEHFLGLQKIF